MIGGEANKLPALVGMTILTVALRPLAHKPPVMRKTRIFLFSCVMS
jgi:hypothetical protein